MELEEIEVKEVDLEEIEIITSKTTDNDFEEISIEPASTVELEDIETPMQKSQVSMFDDIPVNENKKPEIASVGGKWVVKNDLKGTSDFHKQLKENYVNGTTNNFTEFLKSDHPLAGAVAKYHGIDMNGKNDTLHIPEEKRKEIQSHYNNITGRFKGRTSGIGQEQTRTLLSDTGGVELGDWHFQVPSLSDKAKLELDSRTIQDTHRAANEGELSEEPMKWLKKYKYVEGREAEGSDKNKVRMLYDKDADNFDSHTAGIKGGLLTEPEKQRHQELSSLNLSPLSEEDRSRLKDLKGKKSTKSLDLTKLSDSDKELYNDIQSQKAQLQNEGAHLDTNRNEDKKAQYQNVLDQEQDLVNKYGGITKQDKPLNNNEENELAMLSDREEFENLNAKYNRTYTPQIQKILKYPHESNLKAAPEEDNIPEEQGGFEEIDTNPKDDINQHFPAQLLQGKDLEHKLSEQGMGLNQKYSKFYKPQDTFMFNGDKHEVMADGGNYVTAKNTANGKVKTIVKADIDKFPHGKYPELSKESVKKYLSDEPISLEDIYSKMGFPSNHENKEYVKNRIKRYLIQNEHNVADGEHNPLVSRILASEGHPNEINQNERKILYKIAKSLARVRDYFTDKFKQHNLSESMESLFIEQKLTPFEKSLESKNIFEVGDILINEAKKLDGYLDTIMNFSLEKSIENEYYDSNLTAIKNTTERFVSSHNRFDMLKSISGEELIKSLNKEQNKIDNLTRWKLTDGKVESILLEDYL